MDSLGEIRHQAAIAGRVTNQQDGSPIVGARISLTTQNAAFGELLALKALAAGRGWGDLAVRLDRAVSGDDGRFCFLNLPDGTYTVKAEWIAQGNRFGTATASATVTRDANGAIKLAAVELVLPPTRVIGRVSANAAAVPMAEVRLRGGESTFTDAEGGYALSAIEPGERTVRVQAEGLAAAESRVSVAGRGETVTMNFSLT